MKIVVAPDSFKDSLKASDVAVNIKIGIMQAMPDASVHCLPLADGGEGTLEAMVYATSGRFENAYVLDPLGREIEASFGILGDADTAIIEMATASGIELLHENERNPWVTTTYGTGQLINKALSVGCTKIILGIGGSATNDCGAGMFQALGGSLKDRSGKEISFGGGALSSVESIDISNVNPLLKNCTLTVACDVSNPLIGEQGASYVYGPQKGADGEMVKKLDANLSYFANKIKEYLHIEVANFAGAGAAGGLGGGLLAFCNASLTNGFSLITDAIQFEEKIQGADLVITGEGKIDCQTRYGKVPQGVASIAKKYNIPVIAISGTMGEGVEELYAEGIDAVFSIVNAPMNLEFALQNAPFLLQQASRNVMKTFMLSNK